MRLASALNAAHPRLPADRWALFLLLRSVPGWEQKQSTVLFLAGSGGKTVVESRALHAAVLSPKAAVPWEPRRQHRRATKPPVCLRGANQLPGHVMPPSVRLPTVPKILCSEPGSPGAPHRLFLPGRQKPPPRLLVPPAAEGGGRSSPPLTSHPLHRWHVPPVALVLFHPLFPPLCPCSCLSPHLLCSAGASLLCFPCSWQVFWLRGLPSSQRVRRRIRSSSASDQIGLNGPEMTALGSLQALASETTKRGVHGAADSQKAHQAP